MPPKLAMGELTVRRGPGLWPVPCNEPAATPADVVTFKDAAKGVVAVGANVTGTVKVPPAASEAGKATDGVPTANAADDVPRDEIVTACCAVRTTLSVF